jgi:hypothetical protein
MRFDEAFDILVEHCARVSADLAAAAGQRVSTYGNDIWTADIVKSYWVQRRAAQETLTQQRYLPFALDRMRRTTADGALMAWRQ